ncbi:Papain cysteine protease [Globodera pallida]|nr:Papain cysteine protease [Globodera pallida]
MTVQMNKIQRCHFLIVLLLFFLAILVLDVFCKNNKKHKKSSSSSSSSSESSSSESDEKSTEFLSDQRKEKRRSRAESRVSKCNQRNGGQWTALFNERFALMSTEHKRHLAGLLPIDSNGTIISATQPTTPAAQTSTRPTISKRRRKRATCTSTISFDARTQWPNCAAIINKLQDQSNCGSCWAVATASVFNDRYCINRLKQGLNTNSSLASSYFSATDILSCSPNSYGCDGGSPYHAWNWVKSAGVVSGTDYPTKSGCKPYPFAPNSRTAYTTPNCTSKCSNTAWSPSYSADRKYSTATGFLQGPSSTVTAIQKEIKKNGPVVASMKVYSDLYYYSTGVYTATSTTYDGGHAVRLIGWGVQTCTDGTSQDYWLAMNSWNTDWGQRGLFQIAKGVDECGIESMGIFYGTPKV